MAASTKISTSLTKANISTILGILADSPRQLAAISVHLSPEQTRQPLGADERSLAEGLAHLVNCEARHAEWIYLALMVDEPFVYDIHPERNIGKLLHTEECDFAELLAYFTFRRTTLLNVLNRLSDAQWARAVREENKQRKETVYLMARSMALHELDHVTDLRAKILALYPAPPWQR